MDSKGLFFSRLTIKSVFFYLLTLMLLFGCTQKPQPPLRVGTNIWPGYEFLYLARDLGYYKNSPIKLIEYTSASEVIRAYLNGVIDAAALTMDEVFLLAEQKENPKVVLIMDFSDGGDVVIAKPEIRQLSDLRGKRIGVETTALGAFMLTRALEHADMNIKDVSVVPLEVAEHENAFKKGTVDAVVTFEPVRSNLLNAGGNLLFDSSKIPGEIIDVLIIRKELIASKNKTLNVLLSGWFKALDYFTENPEDGSRRIAPREGVTPEQFLTSLEGLHIPDKKENINLLSKQDPALYKGMGHLSRFMVDSHLLKEPVKLALILESGPIKEIK